MKTFKQYLTEVLDKKYKDFFDTTHVMFPTLEIREMTFHVISFTLTHGSGLREVEKVMKWLERNGWKERYYKSTNPARRKQTEFHKDSDELWLSW